RDATPPALLQRRVVAGPHRGRPVQPGPDAHHALSLPGSSHPGTMASQRMNITGAHKRDSRRARCRDDWHAGFGRRLGETHRSKYRKGAPSRPHTALGLVVMWHGLGVCPSLGSIEVAVARIFTGPRGGRITTAVLRDATHWDEVVTQLGYEHLRRHDLRHTGLLGWPTPVSRSTCSARSPGMDRWSPPSATCTPTPSPSRTRALR